MLVPFSAIAPPVTVKCGPPNARDAHVRAFCERISPVAKPVLISIQPEPECVPRECFENVRQKTKTHGGRIRCGWAIWEWPRVFIEAEYHAVYEAPDVSLHDLTPSIPEDPQRARLFLPDDSAVYDFGDPDGSRRDNIRHPLAKDPQIASAVSQNRPLMVT